MTVLGSTRTKSFVHMVIPSEMCKAPQVGERSRFLYLSSCLLPQKLGQTVSLRLVVASFQHSSIPAFTLCGHAESNPKHQHKAEACPPSRVHMPDGIPKAVCRYLRRGDSCAHRNPACTGPVVAASIKWRWAADWFVEW